jgi:hypothetical protein
LTLQYPLDFASCPIDVTLPFLLDIQRQGGSSVEKRTAKTKRNNNILSTKHENPKNTMPATKNQHPVAAGAKNTSVGAGERPWDRQ